MLADRLTIQEERNRYAERAILTLTEFEHGIAFVGRQVRLDVTDEHGDTDEFVIDLSFYHIPQSF